MPQPRQRAVSPSDAHVEQSIEGLALLFGQAAGELVPQLSLHADTNRAAEPFDRRQWWQTIWRERNSSSTAVTNVGPWSVASAVGNNQVATSDTWRESNVNVRTKWLRVHKFPFVYCQRLWSRV